MSLQLNQRTVTLCEQILARADELQVAVQTFSCGTTLIDFGIDALGNQAAGIMLARACLADLAEVEIQSNDTGQPLVTVVTDHPVAACMASQYAGWEIKGEKFFAMGSGPMRAAAAREPLFKDIGHQESPQSCVGILEASKFPTDEVCQDIAAKCKIDPVNLLLLVAPTSSLAGTLQVVARSVETSLHKLHELGFDLNRVTRGVGTAPLAPVAEGDLAAIGVSTLR